MPLTDPAIDPAAIIASADPADVARLREHIALALYRADPAEGIDLESRFRLIDDDERRLFMAHIAAMGPTCECALLGIDAALACRVRRLIDATDRSQRARSWPPPAADCSRARTLILLGSIIAEHRSIFTDLCGIPTWSPQNWLGYLQHRYDGDGDPGPVLILDADELLRASRMLDRVVEAWACVDDLGDHDPGIIDPTAAYGDDSDEMIPSINVEGFCASTGPAVLDTPAENHLRALTRYAHTLGDTEVGANHRWLAALELALTGTVVERAEFWRRPRRCNDTLVDLLGDVLA